jgi:hypothetical protein
MRILRSKAGVSTNRPQRRQCPRTSHPGRAASVPPPSRAASAAVRMHVEHKLFQEGTDGGDRSLTPAASLPSGVPAWRACEVHSPATRAHRVPRHCRHNNQNQRSDGTGAAHIRDRCLYSFSRRIYVQRAHTHTVSRRGEQQVAHGTRPLSHSPASTSAAVLRRAPSAPPSESGVPPIIKHTTEPRQAPVRRSCSCSNAPPVRERVASE